MRAHVDPLIPGSDDRGFGAAWRRPSERGKSGTAPRPGSRPRQDLQPDPQGAQRDLPEGRGAKLHQILLGGQGQIGAQAAGPGGQVGHVGGGVGMVVREGPEAQDLAAERCQGAAEALGVADPAERHDRSAREFLDRGRPGPQRRPGRAARAAPRPSGAARRGARPRRRIAARSGPATRSARDSTTTPARRSDRTGSRSRPRGNSRPSPNGSSASSRTMSRSRASRRCWNPSSRTSSSRLQLLDRHSRQPGRGRGPGGGARRAGSPRAPAPRRSSPRPGRSLGSGWRPGAPARDTTARPTRPSASCRSRPSVRLPTETTGTARAMDLQPAPVVARVADRDGQAVARSRRGEAETGSMGQRTSGLAPDQSEIAGFIHARTNSLSPGPDPDALSGCGRRQSWVNLNVNGTNNLTTSQGQSSSGAPAGGRGVGDRIRMICPPLPPAPLVQNWFERHRDPGSFVLHMIGIPPTILGVLMIPIYVFLFSVPLFLFALALLRRRLPDPVPRPRAGPDRARRGDLPEAEAWLVLRRDHPGPELAAWRRVSGFPASTPAHDLVGPILVICPANRPGRPLDVSTREERPSGRPVTRNGIHLRIKSVPGRRGLTQVDLGQVEQNP